MVEIPDRLECLFSASVEQHGNSYSIEIPQSELEQDAVRGGEIYRVALLPSSSQTAARHQSNAVSSSGSGSQSPPVAEGDVREVSIETIGDQGDGIAKIEHGYVVIVPETEPGDEETVEIEQARANVAFARVRGAESTSDESIAPDESVEGDTLGVGE